MAVRRKIPTALCLTGIALLSSIGCGDNSPSLTLPDDSETSSSGDAPSAAQETASKPVTPVSKRKAGPVENIDASERVAAAKLQEATDPVANEIKIYKAEIRGAFDEQDFAKLEKEATRLRETSELCRDGSWKIWRFYGAIDNRFHTGDDGYLTDLQTHAAWEKAYPDSITQRIAVADFMTSYAWHARGDGYADTVTKEGWELFGTRLMEANRILQSTLELPEKDPYLWIVAMRTALGLGSEKAEFDAIVARAIEQEPTFWHIDTFRSYSLLPRWYGEEGDWEAYASETLKRENGLGAEGYVRIVMDRSQHYGNVFRDARNPSWKTAKEGLETLRKKYPDSVSIENWCAKMGTLGNDREFAKAAFERLGDSYIEAVWKKPERFVHFRGWAMTGKW